MRTASRGFDALLFDLDGTLVDSAADICAALTDALTAIGREAAQPVATLVDGAPLEEIYAAVVSNGSAEELARFAAAYRAAYARCMTRSTRPYPGVDATLDTIRRRVPELRLAVASSKRTETARELVDAVGLTARFDLVRGSGASSLAHKPAPDLPLAVARELGVAPARAVMIGDTVRDVAAGRSAGMITIAVTYGLGREEALREAGAHHVAARFEDVPRLLEIG